MFNLYVGSRSCSWPRTCSSRSAGTESRIRTGVVYIVVSLVSSILFLAAIAMVYGALAP